MNAELVRRLLPGGPEDLLVWADERATLVAGELRALVDRWTKDLRAREVRAGDTVCLQMASSTTLLGALLAIWRLGARAMIVDYRTTAPEAARLYALCRPSLLLTGAPGEHVVTEIEVEVRALDEPVDVLPNCSLVQFSSGTGGQPKVVGRSAASLCAELDKYAAITHMPTAQDRLLLLCSPTHTWGMIGGLLHGLACSVPVLFPLAGHGAATARAASALGATAIFGVPANFELMSRVQAPPSLPTLRIAVSAGELTRADLADRFRDAYGVCLGQVYGLTETGVVAADLTGELPPPNVGWPVSNTLVRIAEDEVRLGLPQSPYLLPDGVERYVDGWLRTFDCGGLDPATGALYLLGRSDSVVSLAGIKIDLTEIEYVLVAHPTVAAAVVTYGDVIEAHVQAEEGMAPNVDELTRWCAQRLTAIKVPKRVFLSAGLLRTATGKAVRDPERIVAAQRGEADLRTATL